jgi:hypothetical protein
VKTAAQATSNWTGASGRAGTAWTVGITGTQKDQAALAVAQQATLLANFNQAVSSGRWAAGVQRRGTAYWRSQSLAKQANYTTGYSAGEGNFSSSIAKIINAEAGIVSSLPARGDFSQNLQRAAAFATALHQLKGTLGAS